MKSLEIVDVLINDIMFRKKDRDFTEIYFDDLYQIKQDLEVLEIIRKKKVNVLELKILQFCNWDDNTFLYLYNLNRCDEYKLTLEELLKLKQWLEVNENE